MLRCGRAEAGPCRIAVDHGTQPLAAMTALTEPVDIGPGRIVPLSVAGALGVWGAAMIGAVVAVRFLLLRPMAALLLLFVGPLFAWLVYHLVRARYLRFAPRRIEVLRYRLFANRLGVTMFPVDGDTVLFIRTRDGGADARVLGFPYVVWRLVVCRAEGVFPVRFVTGPSEGERVWQALLSTVVSPPLTYDSL